MDSMRSILDTLIRGGRPPGIDAPARYDAILEAYHFLYDQKLDCWWPSNFPMSATEGNFQIVGPEWKYFAPVSDEEYSDNPNKFKCYKTGSSVESLAAFLEEYFSKKQDVREDWGSSDMSIALNNMRDYITKNFPSQEITPEILEDAARQVAEFYYKSMGYESSEEAAEQLIHMWGVRKMKLSESEDRLPETNGEGRCSRCRGRGFHVCDHCGGHCEDSKCRGCHGAQDQTCDDCGGSGVKKLSENIECKQCGGKKKLPCKCSDKKSSWDNCPECNDTGFKKCPSCCLTESNCRVVARNHRGKGIKYLVVRAGGGLISLTSNPDEATTFDTSVEANQEAVALKDRFREPGDWTVQVKLVENNRKVSMIKEDEYDDEDTEIQNGDYIRDVVHDGDTGEVFMASQCDDRKCWAADKDGRGWFVRLGNLQKVTDTAQISKYFPEHEPVEPEMDDDDNLYEEFAPGEEPYVTPSGYNALVSDTQPEENDNEENGGENTSEKPLDDEEEGIGATNAAASVTAGSEAAELSPIAMLAAGKQFLNGKALMEERSVKEGIERTLSILNEGASNDIVKTVWGNNKAKGWKEQLDNIISLDWLFGPEDTEGHPKYNAAHTIERLKRAGFNNKQIDSLRDMTVSAIKSAFVRAKVSGKDISKDYGSFGWYSVPFNYKRENEVYGIARKLLKIKIEKSPLFSSNTEMSEARDTNMDTLKRKKGEKKTVREDEWDQDIDAPFCDRCDSYGHDSFDCPTYGRGKSPKKVKKPTILRRENPMKEGSIREGIEKTLNILNESAGSTKKVVPESKSFKQICGEHTEAVRNFVNGGDIADDQALYDDLYEYYCESGEMPYGTMKARTGDPYQWIHSHFEADLAKKARGQMTEAWDTTMNTPKSKKGMFKGKTLAALKAELAKLKKNPNKTEALKTKEHELTFAIRAKQKDKFGSIKESTDDEMFEGVLGRMKNLAFGNGGVPDRPNVTGRVEKCANCGHDLRKDPNSSRLTHANFKDDAACKAASRHNNPEGLSHEVMGEDCYGSASPTPSCEPDVDTLSFNTNYDSTTNKTSVNVNASGAKAAELLRMLKLAGMAPEVELTEDASKTPKTTKEEESEPWANEPNEQTLSIDAQVNMGNDLHGPHKQFKKEYPGDNPMTIANNAIKATESKLRAKFNALTEGK